MKLPAGRYYIGDPCYVIDNSLWSQVCDQLFPPNGKQVNVITLNDTSFWMHTTAFGDGGYLDRSGREYCVDSGTIGIVPASLVHKDGGDLGHVHEFKSEVEASYLDGTFYFRAGRNVIEIETDPEDEEDEEWDDEDDEE